MSASIAQTVIDAANAYGVDPRLALEVAIQESRLDPSAVSSAGAVGVFQLMPRTAAQYGVDPRDPAANIDAGVQHLAYLLDRYSDPRLALAAYNWGEGNLDRAVATYGDSWYSHAPAETQAYIPKILANVDNQYTATLNTSAVLSDVDTAAVQLEQMDPTTKNYLLLAAAVLLAVLFLSRSDSYA